MRPIYLLLLFCLLLFQSSRSVQSITLSRLCGRFGHICYGANWGKRASPEELSSYLQTNDDDMAIDDDTMTEEQLRWNSFRERLRELFGLDNTE